MAGSGHGHEGGHGHGPGHGHGHAPARFGAAFALGMALNLGYVAGEVAYGLLAHSLALLADAGHNLGDVLGLGAAWLAAALGRKRPNGRFTYGWRRSSILSALFNAMLLLLVTGGVAWEAVLRLVHPAPVAAGAVMAVAATGIAVNGGTALLFMAGARTDLNLRGAFLHMLGDAATAAVVVVAGLLIGLTGWLRIDPAASLLVSLAIVAGTWSLLRRSVALALDAVPVGIDRDSVEATLRALPGVTGLHHLHIWAISTTETALTAHLLHPGGTGNDALLREAASVLARRHNIGHATLQLETSAGACAPGCAPGCAPDGVPAP